MNLLADESDAILIDCSPSLAHDPTVVLVFSALDSPMTCKRLHACFTTWFPRNATCPTFDLLVFESPALSTIIFAPCVAHHDSKEFKDRRTMCAFLFKCLPSMLDRCMSNLDGCCIRVTRFLTHCLKASVCFVSSPDGTSSRLPTQESISSPKTSCFCSFFQEVGTLTLPITIQRCFNSLYDCGFPCKYRSSFMNRCISTSLGCCIRVARFLIQFPISALPFAK